MKKRVLSFYSGIISFFILLLGFSACSSQCDDEPGRIICYGGSTAKYKISGRVVSAEGEKKEVKNIRVVIIENLDESEYIYLYLGSDTVYTDINGKYAVERGGYPGQDFKVKFQDIDGEANGQFEEKIEIIDFKGAQYVGGEGVYKGEASKDMGTIELEPKKETTEE